MNKNNKKKPSSSKENNVGNIFTSPPINVYVNEKEHEYYRVDIEFHGVDHSGPSYEGRVFLNKPNANKNTPLDYKNNYAGSYNIFGHGGCFGDIGHCDIKPRRAYDSRAAHPLTPALKTIVVTNLIKKILKSKQTITVTIVPIIAKGGRMSNVKDVVHIGSIRINAYENTSKSRNQ
jgi:hypothetical protein